MYSAMKLFNFERTFSICYLYFPSILQLFNLPKPKIYRRGSFYEEMKPSQTSMIDPIAGQSDPDLEDVFYTIVVFSSYLYHKVHQNRVMVGEFSWSISKM